MIAVAGLHAQDIGVSNAVQKKFKLKKIGVTLGYDSDQIRGLGHEQLLSQAKGTLGFDASAMNFEERDLMSMVCENPNITGELAFATPIKNTELRVGLSAMFNRVESVFYRNSFTKPDGTVTDRYLGVHARQNEVALDVSLHKYIPVTRWFNIYGGVGTQLGKSFNNEMDISGFNLTPVMDENPSDEVVVDYSGGSLYESHEMYGGLHTRVYGEIGLGFTIARRLELMYSLSGGLGNRWVPGADLSKGTKTTSSNIGVRWVLR